jgi:hypothetical protein
MGPPLVAPEITMEPDPIPPSPVARLNYEAVRLYGETLGLHLLETDEDVLGGLGLWYSWPKGHPDGEASRWVWIACMNSGAVTCIARSAAEGRVFAQTIRLEDIEGELTAVKAWLEGGG